MDFVIQDEFHESHDEVWTVYSFHHGSPVCIACIAEVLEDGGLLPLQKKPALSEVLRLLSQQPSDILQIFMHEERLVWHLLSILIGNLQVMDDTYRTLSIETTLQLIQQVKSEDLVTCVLDAFWEHVQSTSSHGDLLPQVTLLGKMVQHLPALAQKLLTEYGDLLQSLSLELSRSGETTQSAIAYIFIFLCDEAWLHLMSPRLHQLLQEGLLQMLSTAKMESVQMNALGLLKKLLVNDGSCRSLMALRKDGSSLLAALKKLLLSKRPVLQISVVQVLAQLLDKPQSSQYGTAVLESDITEFLFEGLHTQNTVQIECILTLLQKLAKIERFYKRCHAVYGIESILHGMSTAQEVKNATVLQEGFVLLAEIMDRQPCGIPLFINSSLVRRSLCMIQHGVEQHKNQIYAAALAALTAIISQDKLMPNRFYRQTVQTLQELLDLGLHCLQKELMCVFMRKEHLLLPVPLAEIATLVATVTEKQEHHLSAPKSFKAGKQKSFGHGAQNQNREEAVLEDYIRLMVKVCRLAKQCQSDERSVESNFTAPGSEDQESSLEKFLHNMLRVCDETCIPVIMVHWDRIQNVETHTLCLELLNELHDLHPPSALGIVYKLTSAGFLRNVIDVGASHREPEFREVCSKFLKLVVASCQGQGLLPADLTSVLLTADTLPWKLDHLAQTFAEEPVPRETVEAYLHVLYLCFILENRVVSAADLLLILTTSVDRHTSLQELSPLGRKHYLYLFAWASNQSNEARQYLSPVVRNELQSLLNDPLETWYSHDVSLLQWGFSEDSLAEMGGDCMLDAYLTYTTEEELLQHIDGCTEGSHGGVLHRLCEKWAFLKTLVTNLASQSPENVPKIVLLLELSVQKETAHQTDNTHGSMLHQVIDVLHNVFLKNYPDAADHNITGLLQVMLSLMKSTGDDEVKQCQVDVKILYHVMNRLTKTDDLSPELNQLCMLTLLASLTSCSKTDNHVCALVLQHEGVMKHLQECFEGDSNTLYCISCDILVCLLQHRNVQDTHAVVINLTSLAQIVCGAAGETHVAGLNLLAALFAADLKHCAVIVQTLLSETQYKTVLIYLQQLLVQEVTEVQEATAECFRNMIIYVHSVNQDLAAELLSQPWNNLLVDVLLDVCRDKATNCSVKLLTVFTSFEAGCQMLRSNPALLRKLKTISDHLITAGPELDRSCTKKLLDQIYPVRRTPCDCVAHCQEEDNGYKKLAAHGFKVLNPFNTGTEYMITSPLQTV